MAAVTVTAKVSLTTPPLPSSAVTVTLAVPAATPATLITVSLARIAVAMPALSDATVIFSASPSGSVAVKLTFWLWPAVTDISAIAAMVGGLFCTAAGST